MALATFLKINPADSVVVCLAPKKQGDIIEVDGKQITVNQDTPAGHKVLIKDVKEGEDIIKYGYPIGHARQDMKAGDWVNENNLKTRQRHCRTSGSQVDDGDGLQGRRQHLDLAPQLWLFAVVGRPREHSQGTA